MAEVLTGGPPGPGRELPRWVVLIGVAVALVAVVVVIVVRAAGSPPDRDPPTVTDRPDSSSGPPVSPVFSCPDPPRAATAPPGRAPVALLLPGADAMGTLIRRDPTAARGPWTVVVRDRDGSLGQRGAVVTFPVAGSAAGRVVTVGEVQGRAVPGAVTWPIAGAEARIHGDLDRAALVAIAAATRIRSGRPVVRPPAGYVVAGAGSYQPTRLPEARYDGSDLDGRLSGLVFTGLTELGGFEDQLYSAELVRCGTVHGQPAVVSTVGGGNGTIAWTVAPGLVGYLGYSGSELSGPVLGALHELAERSEGVGMRRWRATRPQIVEP